MLSCNDLVFMRRYPVVPAGQTKGWREVEGKTESFLEVKREGKKGEGKREKTSGRNARWARMSSDTDMDVSTATGPFQPHSPAERSSLSRFHKDPKFREESLILPRSHNS